MRADLKKESTFHFMSFTYNKVTLLCGLSKIGEPDPYAGLSFISGSALLMYVSLTEHCYTFYVSELTRGGWRRPLPSVRGQEYVRSHEIYVAGGHQK